MLVSFNFLFVFSLYSRCWINCTLNNVSSAILCFTNMHTIFQFIYAQKDYWLKPIFSSFFWFLFALRVSFYDHINIWLMCCALYTYWYKGIYFHFYWLKWACGIEEKKKTKLNIYTNNIDTLIGLILLQSLCLQIVDTSLRSSIHKTYLRKICWNSASEM